MMSQETSDVNVCIESDNINAPLNCDSTLNDDHQNDDNENEESLNRYQRQSVIILSPSSANSTASQSSSRESSPQQFTTVNNNNNNQSQSSVSSSMPSFLSHYINPQINPFSKTSSLPSSSSCDGVSLNDGQRSTVILAPARLNMNSFSTTGDNSNGMTGNGTAAMSGSRFILRPSILRPSVVNSAAVSMIDNGDNTAPSNECQFASNSKKSFSFMSLSKHDQRSLFNNCSSIVNDKSEYVVSSIVKCSADTTSSRDTQSKSPVNGSSNDETNKQLSPVSSSSCDNPTIGIASTSSVMSDDNTNDELNDGECSDNSREFVFGTNLQSRVLIKKKNDPIDGGNGDDHIRTDADGALDLSSETIPERTSSMSEKRKFEVITGEEDEENVLGMHCRLYLWEQSSRSWKERGSGHLRLNDVIRDEKLCSRIVMRTSGVLRVILNAHLVSGMKFELANERCLRFTSIDGIYLIKGAPKDIDQLNSAIDHRLREIAKRVKTEETSEETSNLANDEISNESGINL